MKAFGVSVDIRQLVADLNEFWFQGNIFQTYQSIE